MTDITTWATTTAADGRAGPAKAVAAHLLDVVKRWRERVEVLEAREQGHQTAMDCCARERAGIHAMLADLCGPLAPAAAPAVAKPGRTRKAKASRAAPETPLTNPGTAETLAIASAPDDALAIQAALDRRAAE